MSDYYKSLISDEEAIAALLKDCKKREENNIINKPRLKPNLNFFQRTVNNLVSVNKRIDKRTKDFRETVNGPSSSTSYLKDSRKTRNTETSSKNILPVVVSSNSDSDSDYQMKKMIFLNNIRNSKSKKRKKTNTPIIEPKAIDSIVISSGESSSGSTCNSDCSCSSSSSSSSTAEAVDADKQCTKRPQFKRSRISDNGVIVLNSSTDSD